MKVYGHNAFELAHGSTMGRDHRLVPKNNQDSVYVTQNEWCTIGVVADGYGSGVHSEIGAQLGVRLLAELLLNEAAQRKAGQIHWPQVQRHLLADLDTLARRLGGTYRQVVEEFLLFTIVGVLLTNEQAMFFALGDGVVIVNNTLHQLGPFTGNMPPYVGYGLLAEELALDPAVIRLEPVVVLPLNELDNFLIGSDGVMDLIHAEDKLVPGTDQAIGNINQFWQDDRYFAGNPELLSRRLKVLSRDWPKRDPCPGILPDDTTLIAGRRRLSDPEEDSWQTST